MSWADRIGRRIKLNDLHVFLTVAQTGSMARAATQLCVSHPVVSRSISNLEYALGVRLLERTAKGVELTAHGRTLQSGAHGAFDELRQTVNDLDRLNDPTRDVVRIGTTPTLAATFICTALRLLNSRFPGIRIQLVTGEAEAQRVLLGQRALDLLVHRQFMVSPTDDLVFEPLFQSPYIIAAGAKNPLSSRARIKLSELIDEQWVLPSVTTRFGAFIADAFNSKGLSYPQPAIETSALDVRMNQLRVGPYLTVVPEICMALPQPDLSIKRLRVEFPNTGPPVGLIKHRRWKLRPASELLIEVSRELAAGLDGTISI